MRCAGDAKDSVMAETKMYGVRFLPALMAIALVCVAAARCLLAFGGQDSDAGADQRARD